MKEESHEEGLLQGDISDVRINATSARPTDLTNSNKDSELIKEDK